MCTSMLDSLGWKEICTELGCAWVHVVWVFFVPIFEGACRVEPNGAVCSRPPPQQALISQSMAVWRWLRDKALDMLGASVAQWEGAGLAS